MKYFRAAGFAVAWVGPRENPRVVLMIRAPGQREYHRVPVRDLVYVAIDK